MGRYSDSDEDRRKRKKKKKRRSRSRSSSSVDSRVSAKHKKSKKAKHKKRSRSRSTERYRGQSRSRSRYSRSRSVSRDRYSGRRRSRSESRSRSYRRRSRSSSYSRRGRSRSDSRSRRGRSRSDSRGRSYRGRSRSRSRSADRYRSRRRSRSLDRVKSSSRYGSHSPMKRSDEEKEDLASKIPGFADMPPSEQAKIRLQMALKAAAAADEKIKEQLQSQKYGGATAFEDQVKFSSAVAEIEGSSFVPTTFKSTRSEKNTSDDHRREEFSFGTAAEFKPDAVPRKRLVVDDLNKLAHPNLMVDSDTKMDRWIERLTNLRRRKLEGEIIN